jgi:hypothetical protein
MEIRTYADRRVENMIAVKKRRKKLKQMSVALKGGRCQLCGYSRCIRALEFHHIDPDEKGFALSERGLTRSWTKIQEELAKTVLLCANCHREVEDGLAAVVG